MTEIRSTQSTQTNPRPILPAKESKKETPSALQKAAQFTGDVFVGGGEAIWESVTGTVNMVLHPIQTVKGLAYAVTHPATLVQAFVEPYKQAVKDGHPGKALGRGIVDIGSMFVGPKEIAQGVKKLTKGNEVASDLVKASKGADAAAEVAVTLDQRVDDLSLKASRKVERSLDKAAKASDELTSLTFRVGPDQGGITGGHLPKQVMLDQLDRKWLFKTVPPGEEFRALGDKAGGEILNAVGVRSPRVHMTTQVMDGSPRYGTIQQMLENTKLDPSKLSKSQLDDLVQSHVGRWLISDHDGKLENFLVLKDGNVSTIDTGQMYRFFPDDSLDRLYQPNAKKPVYLSMWDDYVQGKLDLDFEKGLETVARVEALPDETFLDMLKPYADKLYEQGQPPAGLTKGEFLQAALSRKQSIRTDVLGFYDSLAKERGLSGLEEALGAAGTKHHDELARVGLQPVQPLHPEVAKVWAQSKANAARYKQETLDILTEKLGSRAKAEAEYSKLYESYRKEMFIAANYPNSSLRTAIKEGRIRSIYDLPLSDQISHKGPGYVAKRNFVDLRLGVRDDNPLYVSLGGNEKYARDVGQYGDVTAHYKEADLAGRTLFSDGNHHYFGKTWDGPKLFQQQRFTYYDVPHLLVNRIVKEGLDPKEASRLIEGMVFGGIDPRTAIESLAFTKPVASEVVEAIKQDAPSIDIQK